MKSKPPESPVASGNQRIYFDAESAGLLVQLAVGLDLPKSNVVCGLVRCAAGVRPKPGEERVVNLLKRALGRGQFLAFLSAVADALPAAAEPLATTKEGQAPEAWKLKDAGILAFFAPEETNAGLLFAKASALKSHHKLKRVYVVTPNASSVDPASREDLAAARIIIVGLADLAATLKHTIKTA